MSRFLFIAAALMASAAPAFAGGNDPPAEERFIPYANEVSPCDDSRSLWWIQNRFNHKESSYWNSSLEIVGFDDIRNIGYRSNGLSFIPRRYCVAHVHLNDNSTRTIVYQIEERMGGAVGYSEGVEWCVVGLDRNLAYAPACSVLRPLVERFAHEAISIKPSHF